MPIVITYENIYVTLSIIFCVFFCSLTYRLAYISLINGMVYGSEGARRHNICQWFSFRRLKRLTVRVFGLRSKRLTNKKILFKYCVNIRWFHRIYYRYYRYLIYILLLEKGSLFYLSNVLHQIHFCLLPETYNKQQTLISIQ